MMTLRRRLAVAAIVAVVLLPLLLWLLGRWSAAASVAHGLLLVPAMVLATGGLAWSVRRRRWLAVVASLAVLFPALALSAARSLREAKPAPVPEAPRPLSLLSYNMLFSARQEGAISMLAKAPADVLCLQEVTPETSARLERALGASYAHHALEPRRGAYGVAIFSRLPLSRPTLVKDARRLAGQCVAVTLGGEATALCNVHLSSPAGFIGRGRPWLKGFDANARIRAAQWTLLREHVKRSYPEARHLIVAGDFNTLDGEPLYRTIRASLVDAGAGAGATFPTEPTAPFPVIRIDYVFASPSLAPVSAEVLPPAGSDHRPLRVTLAAPR